MTEEKGLLAACICGDADCRMWLEHGHAETIPVAPATVEALREAREVIAYSVIQGSGGIRAAEHAKDFQTANWSDALRSADAVIAALTAQAHPAGDDGS